VQRILPLFFAFCIAFVIVRTTTFGWWPVSSIRIPVSPEAVSLSGRLKKHVHILSHEIGNRDMFIDYAGLLAAADYIAGEFKNFGYDVRSQEYDIDDKKARNIVAIRKGSEKPDEIIVVGAHYDTCGNPGADDNASAVSVLLELARVFSSVDTAKTIEFVAFTNEEPPFFKTPAMGSLVYASQARKENKDIKGALVLESVGFYSHKIFSQRYPPLLGLFFPNKGNFIAVVGNLKSAKLAREVARGFRRRSLFPLRSLTIDFFPAASFSDHWSFWQAGYQAVMVTDTAFYRNPHYHNQTDTYEKLNYEYMAHITSGLENAIRELTD